jgi:pantetheine-phosphate adenylyltransferase
MRTAIVSGTFDPITIGHFDIITRASKLFDKVVIAVSANTKKANLLPDEVRLKAIENSVAHLGNVSVALCDGLLAEFCNRYENPVLVRGARSGSDFDYERSLYIINKDLGVPESVILPAESGLDHISSTYVRELIKYGKSLDEVLPKGALEVVNDWMKNK